MDGITLPSHFLSRVYPRNYRNERTWGRTMSCLGQRHSNSSHWCWSTARSTWDLMEYDHEIKSWTRYKEEFATDFSLGVDALCLHHPSEVVDTTPLEAAGLQAINYLKNVEINAMKCAKTEKSLNFSKLQTTIKITVFLSPRFQAESLSSQSVWNNVNLRWILMSIYNMKFIIKKSVYITNKYSLLRSCTVLHKMITVTFLKHPNPWK